MIPYKHVCSICKKVFFSKFRGQNICSKFCRNSIKREKKYYKCIICNWDTTIEIHHENGKEYPLCPNHHSLLSRGIQNLEEVLKGIVNSPQKPKGYICPIIDLRKKDLNDCPIINGSYKISRPQKTILYQKTNFLYEKLKENNIKEFKYQDLIKLINWKYERVKKHVLKLVKLKKVRYIKFARGGQYNESIFELL